MHYLQIIFNILGVIHGLVGAVLLVMAFDKNFQEFCFYNGRSSFLGAVHKSLAIFGSSMLIICGAFTFFKPIFAVAAAWLSFLAYLLPSLVDFTAKFRFGQFCKGCAISFSVRAFAAVALTAALRHG